MKERDEWVRVRSADELRVGAYELRNCLWCGKRERFFVLREVPPSVLTYEPSAQTTRFTLPGEMAFATAGKCRESGNVSIFALAISQGRLYTLATSQQSDESERATAPREREEIRGNEQF
jgi:hypothetical protein